MLAQSAVSSGPAAGEVAALVAYYAGVVLLLGGGAVGAWVFREPPRPLLRSLPVAWTAAAAGAGAVALIRWSSVGDLGAFLGTQFGRAAVVRAGVLIAGYAAVLVAVLAAGVAAKRRALGVAVVAAAASAFGHAMSSHASVGDLAWANTPVQWIHVLGVGVWIGGLAALLAGLRGMAPEESAPAVRRFSAIAGVCLGVVALTGGVRAFAEVGGIRPLVETTYGRLAIAKVNFLLLLAAFGAVNRYRHVPAAAVSTRGLRRVGALELGIALLAFSVTGVLSGTVPAKTAYAEASRVPVVPVKVLRFPGVPTIYEASLDAGARLQIYVDPDPPGEGDAHFTFFAPGGGEMALESMVVKIRGPAALLGELRRFGPGHFVGRVSLPPGVSRIEVTATPEGGARFGVTVEIPVG